jgi:long-subunit fatty acid transport protein
LETSGLNVPYLISIEEKTNLRGFNFGLGVSYSKDSLGSRKDHRFSVGAVYNFATNLKANNSTKIFRTSLTGDTVERYDIERNNERVKLPESFSIGVSYGKGSNWSIGTEFAYQDWKSFSKVGEDNGGLGQSWRTAVGGELTLDPQALESYLKRITFRLGVAYEQYPFLANNKEVKDFGINFGFSLPAGRSSMDFAFKTGKRGNKKENILEESYFKVYFGVTFNDQWFIKRKFD